MRARALALGVPKWDCHVHTHYTDGTPGVEAAVARAIEIGLARIAFTEHTEPWQARADHWFPGYLEDIRASQRRHAGTIEVIAGLEAPATDFEGGLGITEDMAGQIDYLIGAAHRYPGLGDRRVRDLELPEAIDLEYRTLMALAGNSRIDAIAHPGATCEKYCGPFPVELLREVIRAAARHGRAIEINAEYHRTLADVVRICIEEDAVVTLGSNAHTLDQIGTVHEAIEKVLS